MCVPSLTVHPQHSEQTPLKYIQKAPNERGLTLDNESNTSFFSLREQKDSQIRRLAQVEL